MIKRTPTLLALLLLACGGDATPAPADAGPPDASGPDVADVPAPSAHPLITPHASAAAQALYDDLWSSWGQRVLSGQTVEHHDEVVALVGARPVVVAYDLGPYTEGYAWKWDPETRGHTFGAVDNGTTDAILARWEATGGCFVPTIQWHWHSPSGGRAGANAFYSTKTDFDVRQAVISGTKEHGEVLRDLDAIAVQLQRLEDADVPILWRPLHEAGGLWFWWGLWGPEPVLALWDIVYERLAVHHGLDNLIWVWSTPEATHYPGNAKLDVFGFDSYPGAFDTTCQAERYREMLALSGGDKIVALTENGPVPDVAACLAEDAMWAYFMSWAELAEEQNTADHLQATYAHELVTTLAERCPTRR